MVLNWCKSILDTMTLSFSIGFGVSEYYSEQLMFDKVNGKLSCYSKMQNIGERWLWNLVKIYREPNKFV